MASGESTLDYTRGYGMIGTSEFVIDLAEEFPLLVNPPIVEAAVHWRANVDATWTPEYLRNTLEARLPEYPNQHDHFEAQVFLQFQINEESQPTATREGGWKGIRLTNSDETQVAIFRTDGLVFSRLAPYQGWEPFVAEGRRLWSFYQELVAPTEISRLGLRFINRISVDVNDDLNKYLKDPPTRPRLMPLASFLYQSNFEAKRDGLAANVIKTIQPASEDNANLILDTDVYTIRKLRASVTSELDEVLPRMRWLKNAIFFDLLSKTYIDQGKEGGRL